MDISNLTNYIQATSDAATSSATAATKKDFSKASDEELLNACKQFEAYMVEQVMKEVDKTVDIVGIGDEDASMGQLTDYFKDEVMKELSEEISDRGKLGLARQMYEQMKRNYHID